jgi:hypothetical protein
MKIKNIVGLFQAVFGAGESTVKVDPQSGEHTFTEDQSMKLDEAVAQLSELEAASTLLSAQLEAAEQSNAALVAELATANESIEALTAQVNELGSLPGRTGSEAFETPVPSSAFGPEHPLYTSADAEVARKNEVWN